MQRVMFFHLFLLVALLASPNMVSAQEPIDSGKNEQNTPANLFAGLFGDAMHTQLIEIGTKVIDGYLDYLAKPQTTKKLATFQKNYYDALVEQGFTKEQAFELLLRFGNPLADGPRSGK